MNDKKYLKELNDVLSLLEKYQQSNSEEKRETEDGKRHILVIGPTGAGKSALINSLLKIPMSQKWNHELGYRGYTLTKEQMAKGAAKIGLISSSETLFPKSYRGASGYTFWDCPGNGDNRGLGHRVATTEMIKQVVKQLSGKLSTMLVIDHPNIGSGRGALFSELKQSLHTFFKSKKDISGGILLVFNKCSESYFKPKDMIKDTIEELSKIKVSKIRDAKKQEVEMLEFFQEQPIVTISDLSKGRDELNDKQKRLEIMRHLSLLKPLSEQHFDFRYDRESKNFYRKTESISSNGLTLIRDYRHYTKQKSDAIRQLQILKNTLKVPKTHVPKATVKEPEKTKLQNQYKKLLSAGESDFKKDVKKQVTKIKFIQTEIDEHKNEKKVTFWAEDEGAIIEDTFLFWDTLTVPLKYDNKTIQLLHADVFKVNACKSKHSYHLIPEESFVSSTKNREERQHKKIDLFTKIRRLKKFRALIEKTREQQREQTKAGTDRRHIEQLIEKIRGILFYYRPETLSELFSALKKERSCYSDSFRKALRKLGLSSVQIERYIQRYYKHGNRYFVKASSVRKDCVQKQINLKQGKVEVCYHQPNFSKASAVIRLKAKGTEYYKKIIKYYQDEIKKAENLIDTYQRYRKELKLLKSFSYTDQKDLVQLLQKPTQQAKEEVKEDDDKPSIVPHSIKDNSTEEKIGKYQAEIDAWNKQIIVIKNTVKNNPLFEPVCRFIRFFESQTEDATLEIDSFFLEKFASHFPKYQEDVQEEEIANRLEDIKARSKDRGGINWLDYLPKEDPDKSLELKALEEAEKNMTNNLRGLKSMLANLQHKITQIQNDTNKPRSQSVVHNNHSHFLDKGLFGPSLVPVNSRQIKAEEVTYRPLRNDSNENNPTSRNDSVILMNDATLLQEYQN